MSRKHQDRCGLMRRSRRYNLVRESCARRDKVHTSGNEVLSRTLNSSVLGETLTCALCVAGGWSGRMAAAGAWGFQGGRGNSPEVFPSCAAAHDVQQVLV